MRPKLHCYLHLACLFKCRERGSRVQTFPHVVHMEESLMFQGHLVLSQNSNPQSVYGVRRTRRSKQIARKQPMQTVELGRPQLDVQRHCPRVSSSAIYVERVLRQVLSRSLGGEAMRSCFLYAKVKFN